MKYNFLAVIIPMKWLPQNKERARTQAWTVTSQKLLPDLGRLYSRFYPASRPWGQEVPEPFSVVLGNENPVTFLNVYYQAKKKQEEAATFHSTGMLKNIDWDRTQKVGDTLICNVVADGNNPALEAHSFWHLAMMSGRLMPDCGIYYMEQQKSVINPEQERAVSAHLSDYALCAVALEFMEGKNEA